MITVALDGPEPWVASLSAAARTWPQNVSLADEAEAGAPTVWASVGEEASPLTTFDAVPDGHARAVVWSREPLGPARLSSWAWRCVRHLDGGELWTAAPDAEQVRTETLPATAPAVKATRSWVASMFAPSPRVDDLVLAASEIAANAVQHGRGPTELAAIVGSRGIVIEVSDREPTLAPFVLPLRPYTSSGRGMAIVDVISDCWGVTVLPHRKVVWCEFLDLEGRNGH